MKKKNYHNLILSSSSLARKELLNKFGISYKSFYPNVNESPLINEFPENYVRRVSLLKAKEAKLKYKNDFIIAADTIVYCRKKFFFKTSDYSIAFDNLKSLSGRRHTVYTGLTMICPKDIITYSLTKTKIKFRLLNKNEIIKYLKLDEWKESTGSYRLQGYAGAFISFISGSYASAVGLPLEKLYPYLNKNNLI